MKIISIRGFARATLGLALAMTAVTQTQFPI